MPRNDEPLTLDSLYLLFRRVLRWVVFAMVALIVGVVVIVSAVNRAANDGKDAAREAQATADRLLEQRTEARIQTCEKDKRFAEAHNRLVQALATAGGTRPVRPQDQAAVDANTVTIPDCTPEGIAAFYAGQKP